MNLEQKIVIFITSNSFSEAESIANALVEEGFAACCNIIIPVTSIYRWKGEIHRDQEVLLIIKTKGSKFNELQVRVKELHSYEVPEIIALPIVDGLPAYLQWIENETGGKKE